MIKYYNFKKIQKVSTLSTQLSWSHYCELLSLNGLNEINYYINLSVSQSLSARQLREKIKSNEYERLDGKRVNK